MAIRNFSFHRCIFVFLYGLYNYYFYVIVIIKLLTWIHVWQFIKGTIFIIRRILYFHLVIMEYSCMRHRVFQYDESWRTFLNILHYRLNKQWQVLTFYLWISVWKAICIIVQILFKIFCFITFSILFMYIICLLNYIIIFYSSNKWIFGFFLFQ